MASKVYYISAEGLKCAHCHSKAARQLLEKVIETEDIELQSLVPLKVHFGEKGNKTYLKPELSGSAPRSTWITA